MIRLLLCLTTLLAAGVTATSANAAPSSSKAQITTFTATAVNVGNDISWPQCGTAPPAHGAFAVVGLNGGKANNFNACFAIQWAWAQASKGGTNQPAAQPYLNTGNPGDVLAQYDVTSWPTSSDPADPYGPCTGIWTDDQACAWQYGVARANDDLQHLAGLGLSYTGRVWLDIETSNSWTASFARNQAAIEGMVFALARAGDAVGLYAGSGTWSGLFGPVAVGSPLYSLPEWRPGARTLRAAQSNCALAPFMGNGKITLTQYVANNLDYDWPCS